MSKCKRAGGEKRGNSTDRRNRRNKMLRVHGDGNIAACVHCGDPVDYHTMEVDRILPGGTYAFANCQVACKPCNRDRSDNLAWTPPRAAPALVLA